MAGPRRSVQRFSLLESPPPFARGPSPAATAAKPMPPPADTRLPPTHIRRSHGVRPPAASAVPMRAPAASSGGTSEDLQQIPCHSIPRPPPQGRPALSILHSGPRIPPKVSRLPSPEVSTPLDRVSIRVDTRFSGPRREKPLLPSRRVSTPLDTSDLVRAFQTRETSTVEEFGARRASPMGRLLGTFVRTYGSVSASVSNGAVRQYGNTAMIYYPLLVTPPLFRPRPGQTLPEGRKARR